MCDIGTIPSIHARLREEGYPIFVMYPAWLGAQRHDPGAPYW